MTSLRLLFLSGAGRIRLDRTVHVSRATRNNGFIQKIGHVVCDILLL